MNDQIDNRKTRVYFETGASLEALELAKTLEDHLSRNGFSVDSSAISTGAESVGSDGLSLKRGISLQEVINLESALISYASCRYTNSEGLKVNLAFEGSVESPFDKNQLLSAFVMIFNCRMDRNQLPAIMSSVTDDERPKVLEKPKKAYALTKKIFDITNSKRCIGIDSKNYTGSVVFEDPPAFYFSRTEPWILSELLEDTP